MCPAKVFRAVIHHADPRARAAGLTDEVPPQPGRGLGTKTTHGAHVLNGNDPIETAFESEQADQAVGILTRCIRDEPAVTIQHSDPAPKASHPAHMTAKRLERMSLTQELIGVGAMVPNQPQKGGAVTMPVGLPKGGGLGTGKGQVSGNPVGHQPVDLRHHGPARVVKGVVQVQEPEPGARRAHGAQCDRIMVPTPWLVRISSSRLLGTRPSMM